MKTDPTYNSLSNALVGMNLHYINADIPLYAKLDFSPEWCSRPYLKDKSIKYDVDSYPRMQTSVFIQNNQQVQGEIGNKYALKSIMSLDGMFSPVSFYPTPYSTTFNMTKYTTESCPFCYGTKTYRYRLPSDSISLNLTTTTATTIENSQTQYDRKCPFCESLSDKQNKTYKSASPSEVMPPFILASGDDLKIISQMPTTGLSGNPVINYTTLNPIVLSTGEFSNFQNKQEGDNTGHCIEMIAYGVTLPLGFEGLRAGNSIERKKAYSDYDGGVIRYREAAVEAGVNMPVIPPLPNNMRFFGLRGPVVLHGWGYDLEGYPVPNSSGEPLLKNGILQRDTEGNILGKNQVQKNDGTWTKPFKENTFYKGWAQEPGSWPVGPIDFRWDDTAGVWTVGANYKAVHIVIEEDLVGINPVRGEIIDSSYDNSPLPDDLRRLVFVKDSIGIYSAPRGAALYCKYNSNNGFYEPIGHRPFMTSGTIQSSNTVDIYKIYTKPNDPNIRLSEDPKLEKYNTTFKNPLKFNVTTSDVALFTFIDGNWTIYSYNPSC